MLSFCVCLLIGKRMGISVITKMKVYETKAIYMGYIYTVFHKNPDTGKILKKYTNLTMVNRNKIR